MKKITLYLIFVLVLFTHTSAYSQSIDNLSQIYFLADSSVADIVKHDKLNSLNYNIKLIAPDNYELIKNHVLFSFGKSGIADSTKNNRLSIIYAIDKAGVNYLNIFRDGWFGNYLLERKTFLKGSVRILDFDNHFSKEFYYSITDTVEYDNLNQLENPSLPFTKNKVPAEPFFSSLFEPLIAVGTFVVTVLLLFNVRSN